MTEKREIQGRWWPKGKPESVLYGILSVDAEERIRLVTKDVHPRAPIEVMQPSASLEHGEDIIFGRDEHNTPITLFFCYPQNWSTSTGFQMLRYNVGYAFIGREFDSWDAVTFDAINIDFTNFHTWLNLPAFSDHKRENDLSYVGYKHPEDIVHALNDGTEMSIFAVSTSSGDNAVDETVLRLGEKRFIMIRWKSPVDMKTVKEWVSLLRRFLSLALGVTVDLRSLTGERPDHVWNVGEGGPLRKKVEILGPFGSSLHREYRRNALLPYDEVKDNLGEVIKRWVAYGEKLSDVLDLYFSVIFNPELYSNHRFLFLAQALERYHAIQCGGQREPPPAFAERIERVRSSITKEDSGFLADKLRWANEKTLLERLTELLAQHRDLVGDVVAEFPQFPTLVKDTRNYYTHFDPELMTRGKVAARSQLIWLIQAMRILLEVLFLHDLGMNAATIARAKKRRAVHIQEYP